MVTVKNITLQNMIVNLCLASVGDLFSQNDDLLSPSQECYIYIIASSNFVSVSGRIPQSKKKGQTYRRKSSLTRKSTSPLNQNNKKAGQCQNSEPPVLCAVSPPPVNKISKVSSTESKQDNTRTDKENIITTSVNNVAFSDNERNDSNADGNVHVRSIATDSQTILNSDDVEKMSTVLESHKTSQSDRPRQSISIPVVTKGISPGKFSADHQNKATTYVKSNKAETSAVKPINKNKVNGKLKKEHHTLISMSTKTEVILEEMKNNKNNENDEENVSCTTVETNDGLKAVTGITCSEQTNLEYVSGYKNTIQEIKGETEKKFKNITSKKNDAHSVVMTKTALEIQPKSSQKRSLEIEASVHCNKYEPQVVNPFGQSSKVKSVKFTEDQVEIIKTPIKQVAIQKIFDNDKNRDTIETKKITKNREGNIDYRNHIVNEEELFKSKHMSFIKHMDTVETCEKLESAPCNKSVPSKLDDGINIETVEEKEFFDSFMIDSQTDLTEEKENMEAQNKNTKQIDEIIISSNLDCRNSIVKSVDNTKHNFLKDCLRSESLFTQDDLYCSFNTSLEYIKGVDKDLNKSSINTNNLNNRDFDTVTGLKGATTKHSNKSDNESNVSDTDLEMNISESGIDASMELIAASNYDRVVCSNESRTQDQGINDSYVDLHIPYQSGQEQYFENMDDHKHNIASKDVGEVNILGNLESQSVNNGILGKFSSPKPMLTACAYDNNDLQEDMAIALEMGDSFSSTFSTQVISKVPRKEDTVPHEKAIDKDHMGDSLTLSMMENVLNDDTYDSTEKTNENNLKSKPCCDNDSLHSSRTVSDLCNNSNHDVLSVIPSVNLSQGNIKLKENSNYTSTVPKSCFKKPELSPGTLSVLNNMCDSFTTPDCKSAPKRAKHTLGSRTPKSRKINAVDYSTPEALNIDKKRTRGKQKSGDKQVPARKRNAENKSADDHGLTCDKKRLKNLYLNEKTPEESRRDSLQNTSTESDFVPPTPPDESQSSSPLCQPKTPKSSLRLMSPFSPKLRHHKNVQSPEVKRLLQTYNEKNESEMLQTQTAGKVLEGLFHKESGLGSKGSRVTEEDKNTLDNECEKLDENIDEDNKLPASFLDLNETGIPLTQSSFTVIDVCADKRLFKTFIMEWRTKTRYAIALACEKRPETIVPGSGIGGKFQKGN